MVWQFHFFNFPAHASLNSAIILAARCRQKSIQRLSLTERMTPVQIIYLTDPLKSNLTEKVGHQRTIDIFQLTTTEELPSYEGRFVKVGVVFHALYFENEVGDPPIFLHF